MNCTRCIGGRMLGDSCVNCGWNPQQEKERLISEALVAGERLPREMKRREWPRNYQLSLMDERNLQVLAEERAARMNA